MPTVRGGGFTDKEQAFILEYPIDLNATQAAIRAGYSPRSARHIGSQLKEKPRIQDAIARALAERSRRTGINQDRAVQEAAAMGLVNITDVCEWGPDGLRLKPSKQLSEFDARAIVKVRQTEKFIRTISPAKVDKDGTEHPEERLMSRELEIELAKPKALELLLRHTGALPTSRADAQGQAGSGAGEQQPAVKAYAADDWDAIPS